MKILRKILLIILFISTLFFVQGCGDKDNNKNPSQNNSGIVDFVGDEESEEKTNITLMDLKELLDRSDMVEVKNLENQIIGQIVEDKDIDNVIKSIFSYNAVNKYEDFSKEEVVATINFFPYGERPIYGLIKEKFIYIEGYYFIAKDSGVQDIIHYFETNTDKKPIG